MYPHKSNNSVGIINYRSYRLGPWLPSPRFPCCKLQFSMLLRQNSGVMIVMWSGSKSRNLGFLKFETQDSLYLWIPSQGRSRGIHIFQLPLSQPDPHLLPLHHRWPLESLEPTHLSMYHVGCIWSIPPPLRIQEEHASRIIINKYFFGEPMFKKTSFMDNLRYFANKQLVWPHYSTQCALLHNLQYNIYIYIWYPPRPTFQTNLVVFTLFFLAFEL